MMAAFGCRVMKGVAVLLAALFAACGPDLSQVPDAGAPCDCGHAGAYYYETDEFAHTTTVLRICVDHTPSCDTTRGANSCDGVTVLFGEHACTWENP